MVCVESPFFTGCDEALASFAVVFALLSGLVTVFIYTLHYRVRIALTVMASLVAVVALFMAVQQKFFVPSVRDFFLLVTMFFGWLSVTLLFSLAFLGSPQKTESREPPPAPPTPPRMS